jgi:hypothetical protein
MFAVLISTTSNLGKAFSHKRVVENGSSILNIFCPLFSYSVLFKVTMVKSWEMISQYT